MKKNGVFNGSSVNRCIFSVGFFFNPTTHASAETGTSAMQENLSSTPSPYDARGTAAGKKFFLSFGAPNVYPVDNIFAVQEIRGTKQNKRLESKQKQERT